VYSTYEIPSATLQESLQRILEIFLLALTLRVQISSQRRNMTVIIKIGWPKIALYINQEIYHNVSDSIFWGQCLGATRFVITR